jgi:hypothetical protein
MSTIYLSFTGPDLVLFMAGTWADCADRKHDMTLLPVTGILSHTCGTSDSDVQSVTYGPPHFGIDEAPREIQN